MDILAKRLGEMRKRRGLTQRQLAAKLNISPSRIALYETGDRNPDPDMLKELADFLGCSTDYLLGRTDDPNPINENDEADIKKILEQKEKAHFDGHPLTEEERRFISDMIQLAIRRQHNKDEEAATKENA